MQFGLMNSIPSCRFNRQLMEKMTPILQNLPNQCGSSNSQYYLGDFACLVDKYLLRFYGESRYNYIKTNLNAMDVQRELDTTFHFGNTQTNRLYVQDASDRAANRAFSETSSLCRLSPEAESTFRKLLAIHYDLGREARCPNDSKCSMIVKIKNNSVTVVASN